MFDDKTLRQLLQRGIDNGWGTIDHLDRPSPGLELLRREAIRHPDPTIRAALSEGMKPHRNIQFSKLELASFKNVSHESPKHWN